MKNYLFALKIDFCKCAKNVFGVYSITEDTTNADILSYLKKERFVRNNVRISDIQLYEDNGNIRVFLFNKPFVKFEQLTSADTMFLMAS